LLSAGLKKRLRILIPFLVFISIVLQASTQVLAGITIGGIGFHPQKSENAGFYRWKMDRHGRFTGLAGITIHVSWRIHPTVGVKILQTFVAHDCAGKFAGITHAGIELHDDIAGIRNPEHEFSASFGPMWYYRRNWTKEKSYRNDSEFIRLSENGKWERKFIWHGGQIQYNYNWNLHDSFVVNFLPGYPYLYTFMAGAGKRVMPAPVAP